MKRLYIILVGLFMLHLLSAQNSLDIFTLSGRYGSPQSYDSSLTGKAQETGIFAALTLPLPVTKKSIWYNSINYFYFHVDNEPALSDNIADPINLHGFILRSGLYQKFNNGHAIQLLFAPRFMSDMCNAGSNSFQLGALAMYEKKFSEDLTIAFGAMYNQEFFGPYLVPLVNLNWILSDRWSISGLIPVYAKINCQISNRLSLGITHFGLVTTYRLNNDAYKDDYIERQSIDLCLFGRYYIVRNIYFEGRVGRSIGRSYTQYSADQKVDFSIPLVGFGDERVQKNIDFEDGFIAELRILYNIPIPEE
jgi:hypothetical protein